MKVESEKVDVLSALTMKKVNQKPFETMEDAILFAISLPVPGRFICLRPDFRRVVVKNGAVDRTIPAFAGRHSNVPPAIKTH